MHTVCEQHIIPCMLIEDRKAIWKWRETETVDKDTSLRGRIVTRDKKVLLKKPPVIQESLGSMTIAIISTQTVIPPRPR